MKIHFRFFLSFIIALAIFGLVQAAPLTDTPAKPTQAADREGKATALEEQEAIVVDLVNSQNVSLDFKDADIRNVLKIISYKSGVNIVATPEVMGNVSIRLVDVPWEKALDVILKTYGFAYEKKGNIIMVAPIDKLTAQKKQEVDLAEVQPTLTEVFNLKYIDAQDAKRAIEPLLSPRGKVTVLEMSGQAGWEFSNEGLGKRKRVSEQKAGRSKVLIVSDIPPVLEKITEAIEKIDIAPQQVLIETRIMEVSRDKLRDIGLDWGTGSTGASVAAVTGDKLNSAGTKTLGAHGINLTDSSVFTPSASGVTTSNTGLKLVFKHLTGAQFEVILHALEEDVHSNTLSAPRILTLSNQEATILVGTRYPILKDEITGAGTGAVTTTTLDYYQDIGIQLNVVPQVGANNSINMVVHPAVTSYQSTLGTNKYPIIETREAETRVLMKDGETIVIGGLLKDVKSTGSMGIPFLKDIPFLGQLFRKDTTDIKKIDLLIFISARIIREGEFTPEEIAELEKGFKVNPLDKQPAADKPQKNKIKKPVKNQGAA
ncbi:type IV pilus secretin PilQ [bacterium]|nr:MAG: type IV pilus secretin PilQ [bacterium]